MQATKTDIVLERHRGLRGSPSPAEEEAGPCWSLLEVWQVSLLTLISLAFDRRRRYYESSTRVLALQRHSSRGREIMG
jgi:hypothetical protein